MVFGQVSILAAYIISPVCIFFQSLVLSLAHVLVVLVVVVVLVVAVGMIVVAVLLAVVATRVRFN